MRLFVHIYQVNDLISDFSFSILSNKLKFNTSKYMLQVHQN